MSVFTPSTDGLDHIWLSPESSTELGRRLHIGAYRPFIHPVHGRFNSLIALWFWYCDDRKDSLRDLSHESMIRSSFSGIRDLAGGKTLVTDSLLHSINAEPSLKEMLQYSTLPFAVYEAIRYAERGDLTIHALPSREWYVNALEDLRRTLSNG